MLWVANFQFPLYIICIQNQWGVDFEILSEDFDTSNPSSITVRIECLFAFQFWFCVPCMKNHWGGGRQHYFVSFLFCGGALIISSWEVVNEEQRLLFRASWNWTFYLLLRLKSQSMREVSRHAVFMSLWFWCWSKGWWGGQVSPRFLFVTSGLWELPTRSIASELT